MSVYSVPVVVRPWPEGGYLAEVPPLQGCWVVAGTVEQALLDIQEVAELSIASRLHRQEPLPSGIERVEGRPDGVELTVLVGVA